MPTLRARLGTLRAQRNYSAAHENRQQEPRVNYDLHIDNDLAADRKSFLVRWAMPLVFCKC